MKFLKIAHENVRAHKRTQEITERGAHEEIEAYLNSCPNSYYDEHVTPVEDDEDDNLICKAYEKMYDAAIEDFEKFGYFDIGDYDIKIEY